MFDPHGMCLHCMAELPAVGAVCRRCGKRNAEALNQPHQLACGTILNGKFLIGCALGEGGFGITYVGFDVSLHIKVAVKEYYPEGCLTRDPSNMRDVVPIKGMRKKEFTDGLSRFLEEARALARFSGDPNIVNVREFFLENETAYIVMEFVEGRTLKSVARERGRMPSREVLSILRPLMASLANIHREGVIHRDISPDNIILTPENKVVLIDFGAAKQFSTLSSMSVTLKPGYSPPEQYFKKGEQGPWTDVYALCATMYRLTTGRKPPPSLDLLAGADTLVPPNERGADFSPLQQQTLLKGMAIEKDARVQDMDELCRGLFKGPATDAPALGRHGTRGVSRFGVWAETHKRFLLVTVAVLLVTLAVLVTLFIRRLVEGDAAGAAAAEPTLRVSAEPALPGVTATLPPAPEGTPVPEEDDVEAQSYACAMEYLTQKHPSPSTVEIALESIEAWKADYIYAVTYRSAAGGVDGTLHLIRVFGGEWHVSEDQVKRLWDGIPLTPSPEAEQTPSPELKYPGTVTSNVLLIRTEPNADSSARATLQKGDAVDLRRRVGDFYYVYSPRFTVHGYVLAKHIDTQYDAVIPRSAAGTPKPTASVTPTPGHDGTPTPKPAWKNTDPPEKTDG